MKKGDKVRVDGEVLEVYVGLQGESWVHILLDENIVSLPQRHVTVCEERDVPVVVVPELTKGTLTIIRDKASDKLFYNQKKEEAKMLGLNFTVEG